MEGRVEVWMPTLLPWEGARIHHAYYFVRVETMDVPHQLLKDLYMRKEEAFAELAKLLAGNDPMAGAFGSGDGFEDFFQVHPQPRNKTTSRTEFNAAVQRLLHKFATERDAVRWLVTKATLYAQSAEGRSQYARGCDRWLREEAYLEPYESWDKEAAALQQRPQHELEAVAKAEEEELANIERKRRWRERQEKARLTRSRDQQT